MEKRPEETISAIHKLMERSARFHSLSGFSLVAAGVCGLLGAVWIKILIENPVRQDYMTNMGESLRDSLIVAALCILLAALCSAFFFTWLKTKKSAVPLWNGIFRKVAINFMIPMIAGGMLVVAMLFSHEYRFIAASCLLFYGLALVNAAHFTLKEIRYLGMFEILLSLVAMFSGYRLTLLTIGFGAMNIIFGLIIWYQYRNAVSY